MYGNAVPNITQKVHNHKKLSILMVTAWVHLLSIYLNMFIKCSVSWVVFGQYIVWENAQQKSVSSCYDS